MSGSYTTPMLKPGSMAARILAFINKEVNVTLQDVITFERRHRKLHKPVRSKKRKTWKSKSMVNSINRVLAQLKNHGHITHVRYGVYSSEKAEE